MYIVSGVVLFFLLWWTVIFVTLPFGNRRNVAGEAAQTGGVLGHAGSAPINPNMRRKVIITTIITAILWYPAYIAFRSELTALRASARQMSIDDDAAYRHVDDDKGVTNQGKNDRVGE